MLENTHTRRRLRSVWVLASVGIAGGAFAVASAGAVVLHPTKTNVVCNPNVAPGHAVTCGVSVTDVARHPTAPTGMVALSTNLGSHRGTLSGGGSCTLAAVNSRTSRCTFTYTPTTGKATRIYASYAGDSTHARSHGHTDINTPTPPPTVGEPTGFTADRREDAADLAAASAAGNQPLHAAILADILADARGA